MSIDTRVVPFSRSFRSLIKNTRRMSKSIKDLKDLRVHRVRACYRHSGLTDLREQETFFPEREAWRGTGPRPTMKGRRFFTASRGPSDATRASERVSPANLRMARVSYPSPCPKGQRNPCNAYDSVYRIFYQT